MSVMMQEKVDSAHVFPEVLQQLEAWLDKHGLKDGDELRDAMWVTDGVRVLPRVEALADRFVALGSTVSVAIECADQYADDV
jgi:inhibitor of KinA sporulation pathway (predicted exonuclease)